jgi:hypothetical protein
VIYQDFFLPQVACQSHLPKYDILHRPSWFTEALLSLFSLVVQHPMFKENSQLKPPDGLPISTPFITSEVCLDSKEKEKAKPLEYSNPKTVSSPSTT